MEKQRRYRVLAQLLASRGLVLVPHGTDRGYAYWGCRCPDCVMIDTARTWFYRHSALVAELLGEWRQPTRALRARQGYLVCACDNAVDEWPPSIAREPTLHHMSGCDAARAVLFG